jgi:hypothetical protein
VTTTRPRPTRRQFVCPDPLWARVMQRAREERTNASTIIRRALEAWINKEEA